MERIVIRHLSGSKAHQIEEFSLKDLTELTVGRDPSSAIHFDLNQEDLVSRQHAKIIRDTPDAMEFYIIDVGSKNGIYVNHEKIDGPTRLAPGAVVQLGAGGPEFQFDIEPRPPTVPPPTRVAPLHNAAVHAEVLPPPTRIEDSGTLPSSPSLSGKTRKSVGLTTVQRLIGDKLAGSEVRSRKSLLNSVAAVLGVITLVVGIFIYLHKTTQEDISTAQERINMTHQGVQAMQSERNGLMSPTQIAATYGPATVHIAVSWKLVSARTGGQVYHQHIKLTDKKGKPIKDEQGNEMVRPMYLRLPNGTIEPWLVDTSGGGTHKAVGGIHTGTGFVVTEDGFMLTNRHVAATWLTTKSTPLPGELFELKPKSESDYEPIYKKTITKPEGNLDKWIPAKSQQLGGRVIEAKMLEGRYEYLDVTFAKSNLRVPASLVRVSNEHDVAMIKVDTPQALKKVDLSDTYDEARSGDHITILGYPVISENPIVRTRSLDPFHPMPDMAMVPDPTVTTGVIGKVIRGKMKPEGGELYDYYAFTDTFQLTANATGAGNSGGPLFDERGKVTGIFFAGRSERDDARITFAIPIKFGMNLMKVSPVLK